MVVVMSWTNQSTCNSPYPSRNALSTFERNAMAISYVIMTPFTLLLNGFLIYALFKTKQHRHLFSRFILALCISDFLIGLVVQPMASYLFFEKEELGTVCNISWVFTFIAYVLLNFSGLSIFMVSVDRFLRLRKSRRYLQIVTGTKINIAICGAALCSVTIAVGCVVSATYHLFCYYNMVIITINGLAATGILFFYLMTWRNVRQQISQIESSTYSIPESMATANCNACIESEELADTSKNYLKQFKLRKGKAPVGLKRSKRQYDAAMTRTVAAILICCCVTYPPYFIVTFKRSIHLAINGQCSTKSTDLSVWFFMTFFLMFVNSTANAVLYSCHNRAVKELLFKLFPFNRKTVNAVNIFRLKLQPFKTTLVSDNSKISANV